jgi:hypothetical protein
MWRMADRRRRAALKVQQAAFKPADIIDPSIAYWPARMRFLRNIEREQVATSELITVHHS